MAGGVPREEAARIVGCSSRTLLRRLGATRPPAEQYPSEIRDYALELLRGGASYSEVARTIHVCRTTVVRWHPGFSWTRTQTGQHTAYLRRARIFLGEARASTHRPLCAA